MLNDRILLLAIAMFWASVPRKLPFGESFLEFLPLITLLFSKDF